MLEEQKKIEAEKSKKKNLEKKKKGFNMALKKFRFF